MNKFNRTLRGTGSFGREICMRRGILFASNFVSPTQDVEMRISYSTGFTSEQNVVSSIVAFLLNPLLWGHDFASVYLEFYRENNKPEHDCYVSTLESIWSTK